MQRWLAGFFVEVWTKIRFGTVGILLEFFFTQTEEAKLKLTQVKVANRKLFTSVLCYMRTHMHKLFFLDFKSSF